MEDRIVKYIKSLDAWITKEVYLDDVKNLSEFGFKQLNDILFYQFFPEFRKNIEFLEQGSDNHRINDYTQLSGFSWFSKFDVYQYNQTIENILKDLPPVDSLVSIDKTYSDVLFQNLVIISFTMERWGQLILKNSPGETVRSINVGQTSVSLHQYLKSKLSYYNTLSTFALSFTSTINGMYFPVIRNGKVEQGERIECKSAYYNYDKVERQNLSRFPSILNLDSFLTFMKRSEIFSYGYNALFFDLAGRLQSCYLDDCLALEKAKEITYLFRSEVSAFRDFLKDPNFNVEKFILIIRQLTVEVDLSPAFLISKDFNLSRGERVRFKGLADHYLVRKQMSSRERLLFVNQLLRNERIDNPDIFQIMEDIFNNRRSFEKDDLHNFFEKCNFVVPNEIFANCIYELLAEQDIGPARIRYCLCLLKFAFPQLKDALDEKLNDPIWVTQITADIRNSEYHLAPSGANSVAFYGPDVMLGHSENIPNYSIHMLNRLEVMTVEDQKRFWKLEDLQHSTVASLISQKLSALLNVSEKDIWDSNLDQALISLFLNENPYLGVYIDMFEAFASLAKVHNASIEKFLRRVDRKMDEKEKAKLINSPDHGTTYMRLSSDLTPQNGPIDLPSLDRMTKVREQHLFKDWVKPLEYFKHTGQNVSSDSPIEYQSIFF